MTRTRILLLVFTTAIIIAVSYGRSALRSNSLLRRAPSPALDEPIPPMKTTPEQITYWQGRLNTDPGDFISLTYLAEAFLRLGRETGDAGAYEKAEKALRTALDILPDYQPALAYLSLTSFAKHDFKRALDLTHRLPVGDPSTLALAGDAQLELGNYLEASAAYEKLMTPDAGPAVRSRLSRLAWLKGQPEQAIRLMREAADKSTRLDLSPENKAWYQAQLGDLYWNLGRIDEADARYTAALASFSNHYLALAAQAKVRAAQGRYADAINLYNKAIAVVPQPDFLAALGDLYVITNQEEAAQKQFETVGFIGKLAAINQVIYNRQLAMFDANHDQKLKEAVELASKEIIQRRDVYGYDTLAWTLYKNARYTEAANAMQQAMKLHTQDALLYYHAGMITKALGRQDEARTMLMRALAINPYFDALQSRLCREALSSL